MKIIPQIKRNSGRKLIGIQLEMSLVENRVGELWKSFMPRRNEIQQKVSTDLISVQVYDPIFDFENFNPTTKFRKWAAVEVIDFNSIPNEMETYELEDGLYAVFHYQGLNTDPQIFKYIFREWLPNSDYELDMRPHFEILGEKYKNNDPTSEEEIWIPIKLKNN
jgi:AraC family transcriptional regulator